MRERCTFVCGKIEVISVQAFEEDEEALRKTLQTFREGSNHSLTSIMGQGKSVTAEESIELVRAHLQVPEREEMSDSVERMPTWKER
ncbi:hypothetical protein Q9L58_010980 [Maublancomyces gigas]|uniref:Uncharacterized protein n=1 Tax=Discina gigas TaxID=1032678 RepID=A0ABR3G2J8_9PEZI